MPVYSVSLTAPNGNRVSRPIVAASPIEAIAKMKAEHDIEGVKARGFFILAESVDDPGRELEASLLRMNARNRERELWERR